MGASTSRGISIKNPEPPGKIIQITEDVAKRMTQRYGQSPVTGEQQAKAEAEQRPAQSTEMRSVPNPNPSQITQHGILNVGSKGIPVVETVGAYEVRQQKDHELRQNDEFWSVKLRDLEARYVAAAFAAEGEFNKELEKLDKLVPQPQAPVCQDFTVKVAQCYQENSKQALKCSDIVREFALCVERENHNKLSPPSAA